MTDQWLAPHRVAGAQAGPGHLTDRLDASCAELPGSVEGEGTTFAVPLPYGELQRAAPAMWGELATAAELATVREGEAT